VTRANPDRVQTPTLPQATGEERLPLAGFYRRYGAQRRAERKSATTIKGQNEA
jgi:hypothetical protein